MTKGLKSAEGMQFSLIFYRKDHRDACLRVFILAIRISRQDSHSVL